MSFIGSPDLVEERILEAKGVPPAFQSLVANLEMALRVDQQRFQRLQAYFDGDHPHSFDSLRFDRAFGKQLSGFADNWMRLVVKATADRLIVQGFRVGSGDDTDSADDAAWSIWRKNRLDAGSKMAHREAMKFGTCFLMVDPFDSDGRPVRTPRITVESPMTVVGQRDAQDRFRLLNAIKKWVADDDHLRLNLYLPDQVLKFRSIATARSSVPGDPGRLTQPASWDLIDEVDNPLGVVPLIPMENNPDLLLGGQSDLDDLIPLNDALNKELRDMLVTSEYQAFQQRVIIGAEIPTDPVTGRALTESQIQLMASRSRAWVFPNPQTKVESLPQADLTSYTSTIDLLIHHIAMLSQTPAYLLIGKLSNLSAEAIRGSELGFVGKLRTKQTDFGTSWELALALALRAAEDSHADDVIETLWVPAEAHSGSLLSNELVQAQTFGIPQKVLWARWGASPQDIERWSKMQPPPIPEPATTSPSAAALAARAAHPERVADPQDGAGDA